MEVFGTGTTDAGRTGTDRSFALARCARRLQVDAIADRGQQSASPSDPIDWPRKKPWSRRARRPWLGLCEKTAGLPWLVAVLALTSASFAAADVPNSTFVNSPLTGSIVDRDALLALRTGWSNWDAFAEENLLVGWNATFDVCNWTGVYCFNSSGVGRVYWMDLGCSGCAVELEGILVGGGPEYNLTEMRRIEVDGNALSGSLPDTWADATAWPMLKHLDVSTNQINGSLPQSWASSTAFTQLKYLNLSFNDIGGNISSWDQPTLFNNISQLDLRQNNISGALPEQWAQPPAMPDLTDLNLAGNQLSGSLPTSWGVPGSFLQLINLDLGQNALTGALPEHWGDLDAMPWLKALSLYGNQLTGALPDNWGQSGNFQNLSTLFLDTNFLTGSLPIPWSSNVSSWPSLSTLGLSSNALSGTIPSTWGTSGGFQNLYSLYLMYNKLSGFVPGSLTLLPRLRQLWLRPANYALCGTLPPSNFTVCTYQGGACAATSSANFSADCGPGASAIDSNDIQAVIRIVGYALNPFTASQQDTLQVTLYDVLPHISSQTNVAIESFEAVTGNPSRTVDANDGTTFDSGDYFAAQPPAAVPPLPPPAGRRQYRRALLSLEMPLAAAAAGAAATAVLSRRQLSQLPALTPSVAASSGSAVLQAVDVTLLLTTTSASQALQVAGELSQAVASSNNLQQALEYRGLNVTDTQLLYSSGGTGTAPTSSSTAITGIAPPPDATLSDTALAGILVACIVVGLTTAAVLVYLVWRRCSSRALLRKANVDAKAGSDTGSDEGLGGALEMGPLGNGQHDTQRTWPLATAKTGAAGLDVAVAAHGPQSDRGCPTARPSLVFPPLDIAERGIDLDMENLFRTAGAASDPADIDFDGGSPDAAAEAGSTIALPQVPFSDWELRPEDIVICKRANGEDWQIGNGAFGQVYKATLNGVQTVAVKVVRGQDPREQNKFCREVAILRSCRNSNIVQFQGACVDQGATMLVTEFMEGGDLWRLLNRDKERCVFCWYKRGKQVAVDVAAGLHWLHSHRIVHFDVKSQNILLARDGTAKISDVGLARILHRDYVTSLDSTGTFAWAAPELLLGRRCTEKVDIYSFGVVLWEIVTGERPMRGQTRALRVPEECPQSLCDLIARCMLEDPALRPSAKELHDSLKEIREPAPAPRGVTAARAMSNGKRQLDALLSKGTSSDEDSPRDAAAAPRQGADAAGKPPLSTIRLLNETMPSIGSRPSNGQMPAAALSVSPPDRQPEPGDSRDIAARGAEGLGDAPAAAGISAVTGASTSQPVRGHVEPDGSRQSAYRMMVSPFSAANRARTAAAKLSG